MAKKRGQRLTGSTPHFSGGKYQPAKFTGAHTNRPGLVETAHRGTLFLDEIGEMPAAMQVRLQRFLADGSYQPIGARQIRHTDVRIVAATHRDLEAAVADGSFREDLYYRLNGVMLKTPMLDERGADRALLAQIFLRRVSEQAHFTPDVLAWITARNWPGNVRELRAAVECAAALAQGVALTVDDLTFATGG